MDSAEAGRTVIETIMAMAQDARPLMQRVLPDNDVHFWAHYPDDDARDEDTRSRWYYHVHAPGDRDPGEHGHFHLFLHRTQIDSSARMVVQPAEGEDAAAHVTHIAGLSIDHQGIPVAWFTTNRWVTDEFMYPAQTIIDHLDRYCVDNTPEDHQVNRFLTAMVALYRDELAAMLLARDDKLSAIAAGGKGDEAYETDNAILSTVNIDLDAKIDTLGLI